MQSVLRKRLLSGRRSTNIEDRRVARDITKPVYEQATDPDPDPTKVSRSKMLMDHYRAHPPQPMEQRSLKHTRLPKRR